MFCRAESILEGGPNVNNRSFWIRSIPFGAPESIDLIEPRVFQEKKCVLCALEGIGSEFGLTVDSLCGYLPSTVEALLLALFYYVVVNRTDEDKWARNVGRFVAEHANQIALEQRRQGVDVMKCILLSLTTAKVASRTGEYSSTVMLMITRRTLRTLIRSVRQ